MNLTRIDAPPTLAARIIAHIRELEIRALRLRAALFGGSALASTVAVAGSLWYAGTVLWQSAFADYLSLILSDSSMLTTIWRELSLSLLESLPVFGTLAVFVTLYVCLWTGMRTARYVSVLRSAHI